MNYKLPRQLERFIRSNKNDQNEAQSTQKWCDILEKVTLENIHVFCDISKGQEPLILRDPENDTSIPACLLNLN
jgi:hypothetical protein